MGEACVAHATTLPFVRAFDQGVVARAIGAFDRVRVRALGLPFVRRDVARYGAGGWRAHVAYARGAFDERAIG